MKIVLFLIWCLLIGVLDTLIFGKGGTGHYIIGWLGGVGAVLFFPLND